MQLETIEMDPAEARAKVNEYRKLKATQKSHEDAEIARGYLHAAEGRPLIRLSATIVAGGLDERGFPKLAVARADQPWCYLARSLSVDADATTGLRAAFVSATDRNRAWSVSAADRVLAVEFPRPAVEVPAGAGFDERRRATRRWQTSLSEGYRSHVPVVPPGLRPRVGSMSLYHVLWEVDEWAKEPAPPFDPALIRRVSGDLWAVFGMWDLTELERAAMFGRR